MVGAQDKAQGVLERIKQKSSIDSHTRSYNKGLLKSGKIVGAFNRQALEGLTGRTDMMAFVKSALKNIHSLIKAEFGDIESMRTCLLKKLHELPNMWLLQEAAKDYRGGGERKHLF